MRRGSFLPAPPSAGRLLGTNSAVAGCLEAVSYTHLGRDDGGGGQWSPSFGIIYRDLQHCVISNNVLHDGAIKELLADLGGNETGVVVKDNPGSLFQAKG